MAPTRSFKQHRKWHFFFRETNPGSEIASQNDQNEMFAKNDKNDKKKGTVTSTTQPKDRRFPEVFRPRCPLVFMLLKLKNKETNKKRKEINKGPATFNQCAKRPGF